MKTREGRPPSNFRAIALAASSGALLALSFTLESAYLTAWFAFVPLLFALEKSSLKQSYLLGLISGFIAFSLASFWLIEFIHELKGFNLLFCILLASVLWVFSGHLLALLTVSYVFLLRKSQLSPFILFPLLLALCFALFPQVFPVYLGSSQFKFLLATQAIEFTGPSGLDLIIGLSNMWFYSLLKPKQPKIIVPQIIATIVLTAWFAAGLSLLKMWRQEQAQWPTKRIGIVHTQHKPSISIPEPAANYSYAFPLELDLSLQLANAGASIVIWPEARFLGYFQHAHVRHSFQHYAQQAKVDILFQDMEHVVEGNKTKRFSTAVFLNSRGELTSKHRKVKRVPVGETLPFLSSFEAGRSFAHRHLGNFYSDLGLGGTRKSAVAAGINITPLICYEALFSNFVAESSFSKAESSDMLVSVANNAWFGSDMQARQHLRTIALRSIETRRPLIQAANRGMSAVVLPSGELKFSSQYKDNIGLLVDVPFASNSTATTFYARHPNWLLTTLSLAFIMVMLVSLINSVQLKSLSKKPSSF